MCVYNKSIVGCVLCALCVPVNMGNVCVHTTGINLHTYLWAMYVLHHHEVTVWVGL